MRSRDLVRLAVESLRLHRLRTTLSSVAVAIGVTAVLVLAGLGDAAKRYVVDRFAAMGTNLAAVCPGRTETSGAFMMSTWGQRDLTLDDAEAIGHRVTGIKTLVPLSLGSGAFRYAERRRDVYVVGATADYGRTRELALARGRFLPDSDPRTGGSFVVIGSKLATEVFGNEDPVGKMVRIGERRFRVIGVMAPKGESLGFDYDELAIVPVATGLQMFDKSNLHRIIVQVPDAEALPRVMAAIKEVLIERHRAEDFTILTPDAMLKSFRSILDALTAAVAGIAAISVAVAGIGIMNVMLISVSERVAEVGLLKALGAPPELIGRLFVVEALMLSALGAGIGLAIGDGALLLGARLWPGVPFAPSLAWTLAAAALALAAGGAFGFLPARRAAGLSAVDALRGKR